MHSPTSHEAASPEMKARGNLVVECNLDLKATPLDVNSPLNTQKLFSFTVNGNCNGTCSHRAVNTQAEEIKRKQGVKQQLQLREQILKTNEVQRELMALQANISGAPTPRTIS